MLLLDAGNSRIKWALASDPQCQWHTNPQGALELAEISALPQMFTQLPPPHKIIVSNVAGELVAQQLRTACSAWDVPLQFVSAQLGLCGVRNTYRQPTQLGSDRWAALIAAWQQQRAACLVVNCGTATTIDALSSAGEFLGGLILPGLHLMCSSLYAGTAQLQTTQGSWHAFPRNTADAISSGCIQATVGAIRQQYNLLAAPAACCCLSGGAAGLVASHLGLPLLRVDNLVLHGLQIIGQANLT